MLHKIDSEFQEICEKIISENLSAQQWASIESDDQFKTEHYEGGFDATENSFCFSYYDLSKEYWFQLSLEEIFKVKAEKLKKVEIREAD